MHLIYFWRGLRLTVRKVHPGWHVIRSPLPPPPASSQHHQSTHAQAHTHGRWDLRQRRRSAEEKEAQTTDGEKNITNTVLHSGSSEERKRGGGLGLRFRSHGRRWRVGPLIVLVFFVRRRREAPAGALRYVRPVDCFLPRYWFVLIRFFTRLILMGGGCLCALVRAQICTWGSTTRTPAWTRWRSRAAGRSPTTAPSAARTSTSSASVVTSTTSMPLRLRAGYVAFSCSRSNSYHLMKWWCLPSAQVCISRHLPLQFATVMLKWRLHVKVVGTISYSFSYLLWKIRPADAVKQDSSPLHPLSEVVWDQHIDFFFLWAVLFLQGLWIGTDWCHLWKYCWLELWGVVALWCLGRCVCVLDWRSCIWDKWLCVFVGKGVLGIILCV